MDTINVYAQRTRVAMQAPLFARMLRLMRHTDCGEYLQAPVVIAGPGNHFSGFRPDRIKQLSKEAVFASAATAVTA